MTSSPRPLDDQQGQQTVAHFIIKKILETFPHERATKEGIQYWPDPLPVPHPVMFPDPLVLFKQAPASVTLPLKNVGSQGAYERQYASALLPATLQEAIRMRGAIQAAVAPLRIPLGLVDIPEEQKREILWVDLHRTSGTLTGGPLLIGGEEGSGKGAALQTILLWLFTRYSPRQLRCTIIDPNHDLELFRTLAYLRDTDGAELWTEGDIVDDQQIIQLASRFNDTLSNRLKRYPNQHWDSDTVNQLQAQGEDIPFLLLIISHYENFAKRYANTINETLKSLILRVVGSWKIGAYVILTSAEVNPQHIPQDLVAKMGTRIGLFLSDNQRFDLFGRPTPPLDPLPGRGWVLRRDRTLHEVQLALPVPGATESLRYEALKRTIEWIAQQP